MLFHNVSHSMAANGAICFKGLWRRHISSRKSIPDKEKASNLEVPGAHSKLFWLFNRNSQPTVVDVQHIFVHCNPSAANFKILFKFVQSPSEKFFPGSEDGRLRCSKRLSSGYRLKWGVQTKLP